MGYSNITKAPRYLDVGPVSNTKDGVRNLLFVLFGISLVTIPISRNLYLSVRTSIPTGTYLERDDFNAPKLLKLN